MKKSLLFNFIQRGNIHSEKWTADSIVWRKRFCVFMIRTMRISQKRKNGSRNCKILREFGAPFGTSCFQARLSDIEWFLVVVKISLSTSRFFAYLVLQHTQLQFYGATLLHGKLLKDWSEIPVQEYDNLKSKLLEAVVYFRNGPKVVLNRLCISVRIRTI